MGRPITVESLCEKCRELPWAIFDDYTSSRVYQPVDHHKSLGELRSSATNGCRTCQLFWLYTIAKTEAKVDNNCELNFTWIYKRSFAQITIENLSQSFTREERERTAEDVSTKRSQSVICNQPGGDSGNLPISGGQAFMPSPKIITGERSTISKKFVARINVHVFGHISFFAEDNTNNYGDLEYIMQGIVKPWVDDCVQDHPGCRGVQQLESADCAPTRLMDVGTTHDDTVKLVDTGALPKPRYLILSYCWGTSNDKSKTTQANIKQRRESIQIAALPKSIRDAIAVTRHMGLQYLWVDAICIIQEDKEINDGFLDDWKIEAAKMASYYSNALCCISMLSAGNSSEGFLKEGQSGRQRIFCSKAREAEHFTHGDLDFSIYLPRRMEYWHTKWKDSPLMRRAWALQEWILSRRILHCTKVGMFMECGRGVCQINDPFPEPVAAWHHTHGNELGNMLRDNELGNILRDNELGNISREPSNAQIGDLWTKLVTFYSTMNLTDPTDRLVAIDGIARLFCAKYKTGYYAGILSSHIVQTLLWKRDRRENRKDEVILAASFPSWSWSSTVNIEFPNSNERVFGIRYVRCIDDDCFLPSDKVVNYADPSTRRFPLQGPILPFAVNLVRGSLHSFTSWSLFVYNGPIWRRADISITIDSTKKHAELVECLADRGKAQVSQWKLLICSRSELGSYHGLIIKELEGAGVNAYQRMGVFEASSIVIEASDGSLKKWMTDINLF